MLATSFLACTAPRLLAPAMNDRMYADAATQANLATLRERGVEVIEPGEGALASRGERGRGRLPDPDRLLAAVEAAASWEGSRPWDGLGVLVTAGGTASRSTRSLHRQPLQRSDGDRPRRRRGAARRHRHPDRRQRRPAHPGGRPPHRRRDHRRPAGGRRRRVPDLPGAADGRRPADFRPQAVATGKLTREGSLDLSLLPTEDILAGLVAGRVPDQTIVGFAAEHGGDAVGRARAKLTRKGADLIVLNDVSDPRIGFDSAENEVTLVAAADEVEIPRAGKDAVAEAILDRVERLRGAIDAPGPQSTGAAN